MIPLLRGALTQYQYSSTSWKHCKHDHQTGFESESESESESASFRFVGRRLLRLRLRSEADGGGRKRQQKRQQNSHLVALRSFLKRYFQRPSKTMPATAPWKRPEINKDFWETALESFADVSCVRESYEDGYAIASMFTCAMLVHSFVAFDGVVSCCWILHESCFQSYFALMVSFIFFALYNLTKPYSRVSSSVSRTTLGVFFIVLASYST